MASLIIHPNNHLLIVCQYTGVRTQCDISSIHMESVEVYSWPLQSQPVDVEAAADSSFIYSS